MHFFVFVILKGKQFRIWIRGRADEGGGSGGIGWHFQDVSVIIFTQVREII